ncbi:MAG: hypothetical protein ACXVEE_29245 [Polyangiales bacterium]
MAIQSPASHLRFALRVVPIVALVAYAVHGRSGAVPADGKNAADALARALAAEGLEANGEDVAWVDAPGGLGKTIAGRSRAVVRAKPKGEPLHDIFLVRARRSPEGVVLSIDSVHPLTKTGCADETKPIVDGEWIAFATTANGQTTGIDLYDLASEDAHGTEGWKKFQRIQNAITNLQKTGSTKGVQRRHYTLDPPAANVDLAWHDHLLSVSEAGKEVVIDPRKDDPIEGKELARFEQSVKARPGDLITWSVDRVRAISWLGPHFIEQLEYRAFKARDFLKQKFPDVFAENAEKEVQADLGGAKIKPTYTDPEIGWPPGPIKPMLSPPLPNEGVWLGTDDDPFVGRNPGVPGAFVQTFVRTDPQRAYARVYVTLWDPRQVALHMVAGTVEPVSATGEVGTGQIPRTPEVLNRLVAGFNGGFQAIHFEGGMQVSGNMYLPPKPYAATVAELRDGTTAIGTWPDGMPDVPDEILSFRQNLVPIVKDGAINPYKQIKWGGTPPGSADNIHTTRSGVCITKDNFVGYFFGNDMTPESLGKGMVLAGCTQAVHLDMNAGHTGFEFYRVAPTGELPDLMRPLQGDWEAESNVPQLPGWSFRARRMIKGMPHMLFPRYIKLDGRDFMYLTLRAVLPGDPIVPKIQPPESNEGVWRTKGLPQHGFPYSMAMTTVRPDPKHPEIHARVMKIDPRTVKLATAPVDSAQTVLTLSTAAAAPAPAPSGSGSAHPAASATKKETATKADTHLWLATGSFAIGPTSPGPTASILFDGESSAAAIATATSLVGVTDEDGTLVMVIADGPAGPALKALLQQLGCSQVMVPPKTLDLRLGGSLDLSGELAKTPLSGPIVTLSRAQAPAARELFPQTPVVDPAVWQPLQARRVRYFGKKAVRPGQVVPAPSGSAPGK